MSDAVSPAASTRGRLLTAARERVRAGGLEAASSRAITAAAGANLAAITYHFGSKDALVAAALAEEVRSWAAPVIGVLAAPGDPATAMLEAVRLLGDEFDEMRNRAPALLDAVTHAIRTEAPEVRALWQELRGHLARHIAALRDAGAVPGWVEPDAMAALILSVSAGVTVAIAIDARGPDHRAIANQFASLLLAAGPARA
jgi:AcrR family transcriptional regulator